MTEEKPLRPYKPRPPGLKKGDGIWPLDAGSVRAEAEIEPVKLTPSMVPNIVKTVSVKKTSGDDTDLRKYLAPYTQHLLDSLLAIAFDESNKGHTRAQVINSLLDRVYGKAATIEETVSTTSDGGLLHMEALLARPKGSE